VKWLSDKALDHLRAVADEPDFTGTKYELVQKVGHGGMGTVYEAHDRDLDRSVALKVLNAALADSPARERLLQEAHILARLEHPSIVPVHDVGVLPDGRPYYAMKLVRGRRLDDLPADLPLAERLRTFEQICQAVAFAHAHGIIHRDLKPPNVMVGGFGEVLVMDWGVARLRAAVEKAAGEEGTAADTTAHGTVVGTPGYMAPEQARGDVARIGVRSDVYALGGILYFLLTRQVPAEPVRRRDPSVPRPVDAICRKALAPDPDDRYAGAAELAADVARYLAGARVTAYPEGVFGTALRLLVNYRVAVVLVVAYLAMRILLLVFTGR
jgi:serine/threonine-protein kinase